jgi:hypothetical protein
MNNLFKGAAATAVALGTSSITALADIGFQKKALDDDLKGTGNDLDVAVQNIIGNITTFLYIIAVAFALWGGFQILTAAGDDGKVSKGKTILIQAGLGLVVIFLASSIISFILNSLLSQ